MTTRKKIIIFSIVSLLVVITGLFLYYKYHKIKADVVLTSNVYYTGFVTWADGSIAKNVVVSVAGKQSKVGSNGTYRLSLSDSDFDYGNLSSVDGAPVTFFDSTTHIFYAENGSFENTTLPKPTTQGETYFQMDFALDKTMVMIGDTNKNGQIDAADATKVLRVVSGLDPAPSNICQYDTNKNGQIDAADATKIQRFVTGLDKTDFGTCAQ